MRLENASVDLVRDEAAPTAAPNNGPPTNKPKPPPIRPLDATEPKNSALCLLSSNDLQSLLVKSSISLISVSDNPSLALAFLFIFARYLLSFCACFERTDAGAGLTTTSPGLIVYIPVLGTVNPLSFSPPERTD